MALLLSFAPAPVSAERAKSRDDFRRFGVWDYVATGALLSGYFALEFGFDTPRGADWKGPLPVFDQPARDLFVLDSRSARRQADVHSDMAWYPSIAYPVAAAVIIPPLTGRGLDPAWQMTMMNIQVFAAASIAIRVPHKFVGRMRPNYQGCREDPSYSPQCGTRAQVLSFYGGHSGISMAGAGLACAHHLHGQLFNDEVADALACGGAFALGFSVGIFRMQADKHWLSDVLLGDAVGFGIGYGLPTLFYYRPFWRQRRGGYKDGSCGADLYLLPLATRDTLGLAVSGRL